MSNVGDMLRVARQRLGFTQKLAAERLNVPQPVLSRFENGVSEPDESLLERASDAYSVPVEFFHVRETVFGPPVSVHAMLRGKADVTAREVDAITAELNIRVMQLRRFLEAVDFEPTTDVPVMDIEQYGSAEQIAELVRRHWRVPNGPVKNLMRLAEKAGVVVGLSEFGGAAVSGVTFRVPGRPPLILLNGTHPGDRLRFTLAHELGHLVMHRFPTPEMEQEANEFASALLMPAADIRPAFSGRRVTIELLASLKPEWKVSMQSLLMRASNIGAITNNQSRYLWQQISSRGWRLREPASLEIAPERPSVLDSIIRTHLDTLGYTMPELSGLIPLYEGEFVSMYGLAADPDNRPKLRIVR
ncbi:MAG TPA: XRE family transcriptional regulator [Sphingobium sp.]|nr:XRE family transcriptional regulator [Sphingobium sp.]